MARRLSHDETLRWIAAHRAWRRARKTKPIWARPVEADEVGRAFQTADHAVERAEAGAWLCVGAAGEPWFQRRDRLEAKYRPEDEREQHFAFDQRPRLYRRYAPLEAARSWAAQVDDGDVEGFYIQPNYPTDGPLYAPAGGWVVRNDVDDPYAAAADDVWLVQQELFDSTYELLD